MRSRMAMLPREQRAAWEKPKEIVAQVSNLHACLPQHSYIARPVEEIEDGDATTGPQHTNKFAQRLITPVTRGDICESP